MRTSSPIKSKRACRSTRSIQRHRNEIDRRAAAIKRHWSARERNQRGSLAKQLQSMLFASMAISASGSRGVA